MATQAVATRSDNPIAMFQAQLESRAREIQSALPAHISPDKFQRTVMTAVAQNPDLLKADRQSLILACYKAAQDALLPDGREAALVTFNTRQKVDGEWKTVKQVQYMPMVYGLRKKILQSGDVVSLEVSVVYRAEVEKGTFLYEVGLEPPLRHRPSLDLSEEQTTDDEIVAAYSIATMKDGTKSYEIMRRFEINKVRAVSQTGASGKTDRQGNPIQPKGPWVEWFAEMAKKTVMRRHAKTLPMSGDLVIDVEGRDLEAGVSAARALGSVAP
jgi:recombination protein RecT